MSESCYVWPSPKFKLVGYFPVRFGIFFVGFNFREAACNQFLSNEKFLMFVQKVLRPGFYHRVSLALGTRFPLA